MSYFWYDFHVNPAILVHGNYKNSLSKIKYEEPL